VNDADTLRLVVNQREVEQEEERKESEPVAVNLSQAAAEQTEEQTRRPHDESCQHDGRPQMFSYFAAASLSDDRWSCPICLDIFEDAVEVPCCNNLFCEKCIKQSRTCPLCNDRLNG